MCVLVGAFFSAHLSPVLLTRGGMKSGACKLASPLCSPRPLSSHSTTDPLRCWTCSTTRICPARPTSSTSCAASAACACCTCRVGGSVPASGRRGVAEDLLNSGIWCLNGWLDWIMLMMLIRALCNLRRLSRGPGAQLPAHSGGKEPSCLCHQLTLCLPPATSLCPLFPPDRASHALPGPAHPTEP